LGWIFPSGGKSGKAFQVAESLHRKTDANVTANDCGAPKAPRAPRASDIPLNGMETMGHKQWTRLKK